MAVSTMLAPEEVFTPSSSDLQARSELSPAQKRALHNKEKKAKKKAQKAAAQQRQREEAKKGELAGMPSFFLL